MTYVVSDIHGCDKLYFRLLETLRFSDTDTLYILGDVTDRGSGGLRVLLDAASRQNVILLRGNHEQAALEFLPRDPDNEVMPVVLLRIFAAKEIFERHVDDFLRLSVCAKVFPAFRELDTPKHTHLLVQHIKRFLPTWSRTVKVVEHFFYNATFGSFFFLLEISDAGQCALGVTICVVKCVLNGIFRFHRVEILRFFVTNILLETLYRPLNIFRSTAHHNFPS